MLKYALIFCIISLCSSEPRITGSYDHFVLVQQSPITSFFTSMQYMDIDTDVILEYISEHLLMFNSWRWIVQGLWGIDQHGEILKYCRSAAGRVPTTNETEEDLWKSEFNTYGSCFSHLPLYYFNTAVLLLEAYNIGSILAASEISPGSSYTLDHIIDSISEIVSTQFYLKCRQDVGRKDQYLFQVQICFNSNFALVNCHSYGTHDCDTSRNITYPGNI